MPKRSREKQEVEALAERIMTLLVAHGNATQGELVRWLGDVETTGNYMLDKKDVNIVLMVG